MKATPKRLVRGACIASTLALAPVAYSPSEGLRLNGAACQNGTCCYEYDSICGLNGTNYANRYFKAEGPCKEIKPNVPG